MSTLLPGQIQVTVDRNPLKHGEPTQALTFIRIYVLKITPHALSQFYRAADALPLAVQEASRFTGLTRKPARLDTDACQCPNLLKHFIFYQALRKILQNFD